MSARRRTGTALAAAAFLLLPSCRFGLDYSGDESGLERATLDVEQPEGARLSYLSAGDDADPRLLFVHGSPGSAAYYDDYMHAPIEGLRTIAVDRLGYGESFPHVAVTSFEQQAAAIAPLLEARRGRWPIVVGHSLGGPIAARLAADDPERVGALVIVAGGLDPEQEKPRWYNRVASWRIVRPFLAEFLQVSNDEMFAAPGEVLELEGVLDRIQCPVVLVHGTSDRLVPYENVGFMVRRFDALERVYVVTLIGEDHSVTKLRIEEVREIVEGLRDGMVDLVDEEAGA